MMNSKILDHDPTISNSTYFLIASNRKPQFGFELKSQTVLSRLNFSFLLASDRSSARLKSSISLFTPQIPNCYSSHTPQIPN
ncbi:hypothetical protein QL285_078464 [Trifolium repens]|nr:hypothetical protein QL285_078464 [Trifolium repens]